MTVRFITPFAKDKNIGREYNQVISELPDECWIVVRDYDSLMFTGGVNHIYDIVDSNPEYDLFTSMTNRVGINIHCVPGMFDNYSLIDHQDKAEDLWNRFGTKVISTNVAPGFCMIFKKETWEKVGGFREKCIDFDRHFSNAVRQHKGKIGLCLGLYSLHLYRLGKDMPKHYTKHLLP